jgi:hypothetical protein
VRPRLHSGRLDQIAKILALICVAAGLILLTVIVRAIQEATKSEPTKPVEAALRMVVPSQTDQPSSHSIPTIPKIKILSENELQKLRKDREADLAIIKAADAVLNAASTQEAVAVYCTFMEDQRHDLFGKNDEGEFTREARINQCRGLILTGQMRMLSMEELREYAAKAQRDVEVINGKLAADESLQDVKPQLVPAAPFVPDP